MVKIFSQLVVPGMSYICETVFKSSEEAVGYSCNFHNVIASASLSFQANC